MDKLLKSFSSIFIAPESASYKPFMTDQFGASIESAALYNTVSQFNSAVNKVISYEQTTKVSTSEAISN